MPRITELYAYVMADTDEDDEGVPGFSSGRWLLPMMGADLARAESLREIAQKMADDSGKPVKLIRSTDIETIDTIQPGDR